MNTNIILARPGRTGYTWRSVWRVACCVLLFLGVQTGGRGQTMQPPRKATDAEALAGSAVRAFVTPDQVAAVVAGTSGPSNGVTAVTATNIVAANAILQQSGTGTNPVLGSLTTVGVVTMTGTGAPSTNQLLVRASSGVISGLSTGTGILTNDGSGLGNHMGWTKKPTMDGAAVTNINGANFQVGTVNSNVLDTATAAQLALAGTGTFNTGNSNYFGGINYMESNAAPVTTVSPSGLNTIGLNKGWTNDFNRRADLILSMTWFTNGGLGDNIITLAFTNAISGECYTNSGPNLPRGSGQSHLIFPDISPGDYGSISNYSTGTGGPTITIVKAVWKLK